MLPQKLALPYGAFDHLELQTSLKGKNHFATEIRLLERPTELARHPQGFIEAGRLASLAQKAFSHMPDYEEVFDIFKKALAHYATGKNAAVVTFKAFYLMLSAEGFGVKEDWLGKLPASQKENAQALLALQLQNEPSSGEIEKIFLSLLQWAQSELGFKA